ncbi:pyridoxamine 5'-phosphate oxidase family protein [Rapidithrix thailandica]|uniref:Pyridoxamine 5'-phosphate oxidase family protein n=1 Tax=Rapidithrix thailandica TaxID=413964 RepID=A0AAW9RZ64_9BACT
MGKLIEALDQTLIDFIQKQKIFFVATAPEEGRINLSPKGMDTFRALGPNQVAYQDLTGSGNQTAAHVLENGRMTVMFCSFEKNPLILRLFGKEEVIQSSDERWNEYMTHFEPLLGTRQIFVLHIDSVQSSCGFSIPFYQYQGERSTLLDWSERKGEEGLNNYRRAKNSISINGKPILYK